MHNNSHGELCQFQTLLTLPSAWLINTLLSPYQAKKGVGESTKAALVANPKCSPLTGVQYVSVHCVDPCFRLYHTEKDYTSEIIKIATMGVKPIQKDAHHVQTDAQHV